VRCVLNRLTLRGVRVRSTIPGHLVESTERSELDTTTAELELVGDDPWGSVRVGVEVINERVVEVVGSRAEETRYQRRCSSGKNCKAVTHKYCLCPRKAWPARARM
jgi:hypothetical protein